MPEPSIHPPDDPAASTEPSDEHLLRTFVAAADREAFATLARRHERELLGAAKGLLGGHEALALEAVQESWVRVLRFAKSFQGSCAVRTWLYRIVINQCRDVAARERRAAARAASSAPVAATPSERRDTLRDLVSALPDAQREAILLAYHASMTHTQAAEALSIPLGTFKSRLSSALASLRAALPDSANERTQEVRT